MAQNINLSKKVFNKNQYTKIIGSSFTQLGVKTIEEQIDDKPSVQEFFNLYDQLFYDINELGESNSHEYMVKTSGEYIDSDSINEEIEILQKEISSLREELLEKDKELATSQPINTSIENDFGF